MDATDDNRDVKLYRASGDLLPELCSKLPQLVWHPSSHAPPRTIRHWVFQSKTEELVGLLSQFQEWPQLLDPHLAAFIQPLADSFLLFVTRYSHLYVKHAFSSNAIPLPRAVCRLLYTLCKVRGWKVVVRFLDNSPKYIEPILACLVRWKGGETDAPSPTPTPTPMIWEERYMMLVWLSHLALTPFDLATISSEQILPLSQVLPALQQDWPPIALDLLSLALSHLGEPSKEQEAASLLIVRLALRPDMQREGVLDWLVHKTMNDLRQYGQDSSLSMYQGLGILSLLAGVVTSGSDNDVAPFALEIFDVCLAAATGDSDSSLRIRASAPARKFIIKTMRAILTHTISSDEKSSPLIDSDKLHSMMEDTIQYFLDALADKDNPVRLSASKALSLVALKLESSMAAEIVQAVFETLEEDVLDGSINTTTTVTVNGDMAQVKYLSKDFSAVDPLRWQGLMLTLGHLLFRRSPPPHQIPTILKSLLSGLTFEQRSNTNHSAGVAVRDAACFGIWALARKYATVELQSIQVSNLDKTLSNVFADDFASSAVQKLATELVVCACLDPSGNIRRGSSAALQELVGRHPDIVTEGIALVQVVDYHAVARRSHAMLSVAAGAAALGDIYLYALLRALLQWRGVGSRDSQSRREAAKAIGVLVKLKACESVLTSSVCHEIMSRLRRLKSSNVGATAESRHGLLLALVATMEVVGQLHTSKVHTIDEFYVAQDLLAARETRIQAAPNDFLSVWGDVPQLVGELTTRVTSEMELALEAASRLIASLSRLNKENLRSKKFLSDMVNSKVMAATFETLELCQSRSDKDAVVTAAAEASHDLFGVLHNHEKANLLDRWLDPAIYSRPAYLCRGRILCLGAIFPQVREMTQKPGKANDFEKRIFAHLATLIQTQASIELKTAAMQSLTCIIGQSNLDSFDVEPVLITGLTNYEIDQRGDVGSKLRFESINAVVGLLESQGTNFDSYAPLMRSIQEVAKIAAERLDGVRFQAWTCLQIYWQKYPGFPSLQQTLSHLAYVSSTMYYRQLLELLDVEWLQSHIIMGIIQSAVSGAEDVGRASRDAIVSWILDHSSYEGHAASVDFFGLLVDLLAQTQEDRLIVPALEILAFLMEQDLIGGAQQSTEKLRRTIMNIMGGRTRNMKKLEAGLKIYSGLVLYDENRALGMSMLINMLLHHFPKIRSSAADFLFLHTNLELLKEIDWNKPAKDLKPVVMTLRESGKLV